MHTDALGAAEGTLLQSGCLGTKRGLNLLLLLNKKNTLLGTRFHGVTFVLHPLVLFLVGIHPL